MVMATGTLCPQFNTGGELSQEAGAGAAAAGAEGGALHERLVAYVHALAPPHEARSGVWVEHSYARARAAAHAPAEHVRVLLAPAPDAPDERDVDVERAEPAPPSPPAPPRSPRACSPDDDDDDREHDDDWELRVTALAPSAAHVALAEHALDALRRLRLARLSAPRAAAEHVRVAARRLRHALVAAVLAAPGPQAQRPGPWLHATLLAYLPRAERRLYDAVAAELRRSAPRLAERTLGASAPPPSREPLAGVGPAVGAEAGVWLVWVGGGSERQDRRWRRRLGALVHTRVLAAPALGAARPDAWCAAVAGAMRAALSDTLAEAGSRAVVVGGAGAGASLCLALAGAPGLSAAVRGLVLLAPPLLTAEGARDSPDDPLAEIRLPMLVVAGTGAAASWRGAVRGVCGAGTARRVLEVRGADDALRAPRSLRLRRRLPQHALDAAIAEECARWAVERAEAAEKGERSPRRSPPRARRRADPDADPEYSHLPAVLRSETRVVSRGAGGTPLALLPPRRTAPALGAADILRLPIVFADDEGVPAPDALTVTSGRGACTRVIVASRGRGAAGAGRSAGGAVRGAGGAVRGAGGAVRGAGGAVRGAGGARPLLLRRAVRVVPRATPSRSSQ